MKNSIYIFLNGELGNSSFLPSRPDEGDIVIAADGGARHVYALNWHLDYLLGDFDSLSQPIYDYFIKQNVYTQKYPKEKDKTDFEITLDLASELLKNKNFKEIKIYGAFGNRLDMTFANIFAVLYKPKLPLCYYYENQIVRFLSGPANLTINADKETTLSLIPLTNDVSGVTLRGFKYLLNDAKLSLGSSRTLSNVIEKNQKAAITINKGIVLLILF